MSKNACLMRLCRISSLASPERLTEKKRYDEMTDGAPVRPRAPVSGGKR